jgi:DNA mismatch endonuclease (patch repair protein)
MEKRSDVHSPEQRSYNMSRIRGRDTKPEMLIRRGLHARGYRFRLHRGDLPGRPDLVFPSKRAVIFVHGCFWHGHNCPMFRLPASRTDFWQSKIQATKVRDAQATEALKAANWRQLIIWECALRGPARLPPGESLGMCERFLAADEMLAELNGRWSDLFETLPALIIEP